MSLGNLKVIYRGLRQAARYVGIIIMCVSQQGNNPTGNSLPITSGTPSVEQMVENQKSYGNRPDGSPKGTGWLGEIQRPDGTVMTEVTAGVNIGGKDVDIPLITPRATKGDIEYLKNADVKGENFYKDMPAGLMDRAVGHAVDQMKNKKSVYKN